MYMGGGTYRSFFKQWLWLERSHPSTHPSFIHRSSLFRASRWDSNKGEGWMDRWIRWCATPLVITQSNWAKCCVLFSSEQMLWYHSISLKSYKGGVYVGWDGKGRKGFDSSSISISAKCLKEKYQRTCKSPPLPWQNIRLFSKCFYQNIFCWQSELKHGLLTQTCLVSLAWVRAKVKKWCLGSGHMLLMGLVTTLTT